MNDNDDNHDDSNRDVEFLPCAVVLGVRHVLYQQQDGGGDLEDQGEGQEANDRPPVRLVYGDCVPKLVGCGQEICNVHGTFGIIFVITDSFQMLNID